MKSSVIALVLSGIVSLAGPAAAQAPLAAGFEVTGAADEVGPAIVEGSAAPSAKSSVAVTTHHYDTLRTGWNNHETALSAASFPGDFGPLQTVTQLDDQVDAQPLIVPGLKIAGGKHDVAYVVTESDTVYAIDATTGAILLSRNLGVPVPMPLGCDNNGPNVGITSTPVIDRAKQTLYVIAYVNGPPPAYELHALELSTLTDKHGSPVLITASHKLTDGSTLDFNATYERQRAGLLELNGNIYAGFTSFCDYSGNLSRGWLLGWNAGTLKPLVANQLDDTQASSPTSFFLSTIWMSGYGIAGRGTELYFSTGNSDCNEYLNPEPCPPETTYDGKTNIQESVVGLKGNLTGIASIFTPSDVLTLDQQDLDLGAGGVMLFPTGHGKFPYLAAAGGKDGNFYLLNPAALNTVLDTQSFPSDDCHCGPSFFSGSDGLGRVVSSQGSTLRLWQVQLSPAPHFDLEGTAALPPTDLQDPGFFTTISSNGTKAGSAIIWAVGRPTDPTTTYVTLYAFDAVPTNGTLKQLYTAPAGAWPNTGGNANIVPVVANGKVYVVSAYLDGDGNTRGQLAIFGAGATSGTASALARVKPSPVASFRSPHAITGTFLGLNGTILTLKTRSDKSVTIDASQALKNGRVAAGLRAGLLLTAQGSSLTGAGALLATAIVRAKGSGRLLPPDH